ncbi:hypothetical protein P405_21855 [Streptomyces sp. FR-008]|nr:hypothetical protein P405_21855 [Streptomyces sp. FR-008]
MPIGSSATSTTTQRVEGESPSNPTPIHLRVKELPPSQPTAYRAVTARVATTSPSASSRSAVTVTWSPWSSRPTTR